MPGFIDPIHPFIEACRDAPVITGNSERMLRIAFEVYTDAGPSMHIILLYGNGIWDTANWQSLSADQVGSFRLAYRSGVITRDRYCVRFNHNGTVYEVDNEYFDSAFPAVIGYLRGSQGLAPGTMVVPL